MVCSEDRAIDLEVDGVFEDGLGSCLNKLRVMSRVDGCLDCRVGCCGSKWRTKRSAGHVYIQYLRELGSLLNKAKRYTPARRRDK